MTTSYDQSRDILSALGARDRGTHPARDAVAVTPTDSQELPFYGKLLVTNGGSATENIVVVMASNNVDDVTTVAIPIAPLTTIVLPIVVRRVMATGTGSDIKGVLLA